MPSTGNPFERIHGILFIKAECPQRRSDVDPYDHAPAILQHIALQTSTDLGFTVPEADFHLSPYADQGRLGLLVSTTDSRIHSVPYFAEPESQLALTRL